MNYFREYENIINDDDNKNEFGTLIHIDSKFYVNNKEIINNRGIVNDIVYIDNGKIIGIKERFLENIIGILYLDSKIKFGTIKNKSLFLFKPTNNEYPNFYIPYNNNKNNKIYVIIKFKEWKINDKLPIGNLIEVIGDVGSKEVEFEHLRNYYNIKNNNWKTDEKEIIIEKEEDYSVFSIDPIGSKDIDDAFHFKILNDYFEIGIHIASPVKYFENDLSKVLDRVSTIYTPVKNYNLLPNIYSENIISLLEGKKRFAISLIINVNLKNYKIEKYELKESIVKNNKNYDYDQFDKIFIKNKNLESFVNFSKIFFNDNFIDSHKLVEYWMINANKIIAQYLIDKKLSNLILRVHKNNDIQLDNFLFNDKKLIKYLNNKNENSAIYEIYDENLIQKHSKLDDNFYTHFTSPIRRSVDFFIHLLIIKEKDIYEFNVLKNIIDKINIFTKNSKKFYRNIKRLDFLYSISECNNENIITYGYIIKITERFIKVYIPEYELEEKIIIINKKFEKIVLKDVEKEIGINNNDVINKQVINKITFEIDNITKIYKLYDKLNLKLWVFTSFDNIFEKLKIEIM